MDLFILYVYKREKPKFSITRVHRKSRKGTSLEVIHAGQKIKILIGIRSTSLTLFCMIALLESMNTCLIYVLCFMTWPPDAGRTVQTFKIQRWICYVG